MYYRRNLKANNSIAGLMPAIVSLGLFIIANIFWGFHVGFKVLALIILIYALFQFRAYHRVRSLTYLISSIYLLTFALFLFFAPISDVGLDKINFTPFNKFLAFCMFALLIWLVYLSITRKVKWKGREVYELAAMAVKETSNGFTERPYPTGKLNYSKHDLLEFASFLRSNQIALPFYEENEIAFVPIKMGQEFRFLYTNDYNYKDKSWILFDYMGNVTVHISKKDYLEYKENLSFDQLCESMGNLFKDFFELFLKGEELRIIDRLDSLKINIFS
ncbi:MAG: hypothetical protein HN704_03255 [Bacteroidetes bacterium]|jgi:hypothetical protein|nr:hypothetical protein [Bacteroidota bacterium]MBT6686972.1 hypothetical protein [Bacteroidota bacterium]MBT7142426.1 hypothetical protein [Bacteroidota bacterium]MBT7490607.1 hypothetical protein [Bacteroidota bacterium]